MTMRFTQQPVHALITFIEAEPTYMLDNKNKTSPDTGLQRPAPNADKAKEDPSKKFALEAPAITLPKGGGAIKNIDEKFSVNAVNGTAAINIPLPFSTARSYTPSLSLSYNSGNGNGPFGLGWQLGAPSIKRKTDKQLPRYIDDDDSDTYMITGAEDLVAEYKKDDTGAFIRNADGSYVINEFSSPDNLYLIRRYRPRIEGLFARIERWLEKNTGLIHWRVISKDNITTLYGSSVASRVTNPGEPLQVFEWFIDFSYDDKGNCTKYEYRLEDGLGIDNTQVHNRNRINGNAPFTNTYLKRVRYGNVTMYKNHGDPVPTQFMFETVFDYGDHANGVPFAAGGNWVFRSDAFSDYRAGFEIRTCRLCQRVLLYHHFAELPGGTALVKAVHINYDNNGEEGFTFLKAITTTGYTKHDDGSYTEKSLPPFSFEYSRHAWNTAVNTIQAHNLVQAPAGINEPQYQFTDLYSEGLSGILTEQADGWFYSKNWGDGVFKETRKVVPKPAVAGMGTGAWQLNELEGNGIKQLVSWDHSAPGFFELNDEEQWQPYQPFSQVPNTNLKDPNAKFIDLNGDGQPDLLITEENAFAWYPSRGKEGYGRLTKTHKPYNEEKGPAIIFSDPAQTIFLANMSGSGLPDIVRIRNGEVCYWPNLGYGRFGAKVSMDKAPLFDHADTFNPAFIKLADIDGSGTTDIIYLGKHTICIWFNYQGNQFAVTPKVITSIPAINQLEKITVCDLLATGLSCIVWSSPLPRNQGSPLRYMDLMSSEKPHVLSSYKNNLGKEIYLTYKPSTRYYIEDKLAGTPWVTKLHFPVHCVSKVTTYDRIRKTRFASEYSYHHGYYDHHEKEFRGFGRVDQQDAEDIAHFIKESGGAANNIIDATLHQPPVLTKTWYHTGAFLDREKILDQFAHEYFNQAAIAEKKLPEPALPNDLCIDEWRQALRACKGTLLRKEVYALDGSPQEKLPYVAEQHNLLIKILQPKAQQQYGVLLTHESESITYQYERNVADARVSQNFILSVNNYGQVLQQAAVVYKRNPPPPGQPAHEPEQEKIHITCNETAYTDDVQGPLDYRAPVNWRQRSYEVNGYPFFTGYLAIEDVRTYCTTAAPIDYEAPFDGTLQKRLIEYTRDQYRADDGLTLLPFGSIRSKALKHQAYKAAFNQPMLTNILGAKISLLALDSVLRDPAKGGYQFADGYYWIPSGAPAYDSDHFFLTTAITDPFGNTTRVEYDTAYSLFVKQTTDALSSVTRIKELTPGKPAFNYRTLAPYIIRDVNNNETGVRFDELGMPVRSFSIGKKGIDPGDEMDESKTELAGAVDQPTIIIEYSLHNWYNQVNTPGFDINNYKPHPAYVRTRSRETHFNAEPAHNTKWQETWSYSDGSGQEVLKKVPAAPGEALEVQPDGSVVTVNTALLVPAQLRWIGNGRTVLNNKGNAVKQYEPYFSTTPSFDDERDMVALGVTPVMEYDPLDRVIKTTHPDKTFTKTVFTAWQEMVYDANDTVVQSGWYADRGSPDPLGAEPANASERAAWLSAKHNNTPEIKHLDTLGRTFLTVADNATETLTTRKQFDIEGNERIITDALVRAAVSCEFDMLGNKLKQTSLDAGSRWNISNATGSPLLSWDDMDRAFTIEYDALRRPVRSLVAIGAADPIVYSFTVYGEGITDDTTNNLRGNVYRQYDQVAVVTHAKYEFKGKPAVITKQLITDYDRDINWDDPSLIDLEAEIFTETTAYDALARPVTMITPHTVTMQPSIVNTVYNEGNHLDKILITLRGAAVPVTFVSGISYDAKGQRQEIFYGNDTTTKYEYDPQTFRLLRLITTRFAGADILQDLRYLYDASGNIVQVKDESQPDVFFDGEWVKALNKYEYDAVYRLIKASGRKQAGQTDMQPKADLGNNSSFRNHPFINHATINPNDAGAFRNYVEQYTYDKAGNMQSLVHTAKNSNWTRTFQYDNGAGLNNHLTRTTVGGDVYDYTYDAHGNMHGLETLTSEVWDFMDQFRQAGLGGGGNAYYVYDSSGKRVRKVIARTDGSIKERIYLGSLEIYRQKDAGGNIILERETLHVLDDHQRIAMVDTPTIVPTGNTETSLIRYNYSNHLGTACLELDDEAATISYEEYFPFGATSFYTVDATREIPAKRYRYTGKERDEETGLNYHGARYYALWLIRWTAPDPKGRVGFKVGYDYCENCPVNKMDPTGEQSRTTPPPEDFQAPSALPAGTRTLQTMLDSLDSSIANDQTRIQTMQGQLATAQANVDRPGAGRGARAINQAEVDRLTPEIAARQARVTALITARASIISDIQRWTTAFGTDADRANTGDVLTLAAVIQSEAATSGPAARLALAYAWLNRTEGVTRGQVGVELSHYQPLSRQWADVSGDATASRLFLRSFADSLHAATERLVAPGTDPTGGATHWVSPRAMQQDLARFSGRAQTREMTRRDLSWRTDVPGMGTERVPMPAWATPTASPDRRYHVVTDYAEGLVPGVPAAEFVFYRGVRYDRTP